MFWWCSIIISSYCCKISRTYSWDSEIIYIVCNDIFANFLRLTINNFACFSWTVIFNSTVYSCNIDTAGSCTAGQRGSGFGFTHKILKIAVGRFVCVCLCLGNGDNRLCFHRFTLVTTFKVVKFESKRMFLAVLCDRYIRRNFCLIGLECQFIWPVFVWITSITRKFQANGCVGIFCILTGSGNGKNTVICGKLLSRKRDNRVFYRFIIFNNETDRCIRFNDCGMVVICGKQEIEYFFALTFLVL